MPRRLNAEGGTDVTWADAHALLDFTDVEVTDLDYIRHPFLWGGGEEDGGAPAAVYADPVLLRRWLENNHPSHILDDQMARVNARSRAMAAVMGQIRRLDPKCRVTPAHVIEHLKHV